MKVYLAFLQRMKDTKVPKLVSIGDKLLGSTKHGRICPLASRILQKHTRIFKYNVFWKSVCRIFYNRI